MLLTEAWLATLGRTRRVEQPQHNSPAITRAGPCDGLGQMLKEPLDNLQVRRRQRVEQILEPGYLFVAVFLPWGELTGL